MKEIKYSLNKCEDILRSWIKRFDIVKMALVPKSMYRCNVIPIKTPPHFFA